MVMLSEHVVRYYVNKPTTKVDFRERIAHLEGKLHFHLHYADMGDFMSIVGVVSEVRSTEIYNLAAQSHVQVSFDSPEFTADLDAVGVLRICKAVRKFGLTALVKSIRLLHLSFMER